MLFLKTNQRYKFYFQAHNSILYACFTGYSKYKKL